MIVMHLMQLIKLIHSPTIQLINVINYIIDNNCQQNYFATLSPGDTNAIIFQGSNVMFAYDPWRSKFQLKIDIDEW